MNDNDETDRSYEHIREAELHRDARLWREQKQLLDRIAIAAHGWPDDARKTYVPEQLPALVRRLRERARRLEAWRTEILITRTVYNPPPGDAIHAAVAMADVALRGAPEIDTALCDLDPRVPCDDH
jgi:hypothetical protein